MKDEKRNYLIVDASNVECKLKKVDGKDSKEKSVRLEDIFKRKNIPSEYQKIIIMMCIFDIFVNGDACEYITGYPFDITGNKIKKEGKRKIVTGSYKRNIHKGIGYNNIQQSVIVKTPLEYVGYEEIMNFYKKMKEEGYVYDYIRSLNEFFDLNVYLDFIFEKHNNGEKSFKILKLYKHKG